MATVRVFCLVFLYWTLPAQVDSPPVPERISAPFKLELQCQAPEGEVVILEWKLKGKDKYVLLYRDGKVRYNEQNPSFSNRVELKDSDLKSGDLSVILKNITSMDSGTYTCEAKIKTSNGEKEISHEIRVTVTEADELFVNQSGAVELPCLSPGGATVHDLQWTLQAQEEKEHLLLHFRDGQVIYQDPSLSNQMKLRDPELKSGDLTMKLLNVTMENSGMYRCVARSHSSFRKTEVFIHLIPLTVKPEMKPSQKGAHHIEIYFALGVVIIITLFAFGFCKKRKMKCGTPTENGSDPERPSQSRRESKDSLLGSHKAEGKEKFLEIS